MADLKISQLTAASTPLAGTEVVPVVQSGSTKKVAVSDLTAGRDTSVKKLTATDNVVIGTAGKGVDFSANTHAAGMTSELLTWYEEGTWTPTYIGATSAGTTTYAGQSGRYTRVGRQVTAHFDLDVSAATGTGNLLIGGLPFTCGFSTTGTIITNFFNWSGGTYVAPYLESGATDILIFGITDDAPWTVQQITNEGLRLIGSITYIV